jgi:hypothetical protein
MQETWERVLILSGIVGEDIAGQVKLWISSM